MTKEKAVDQKQVFQNGFQQTASLQDPWKNRKTDREINDNLGLIQQAIILTEWFLSKFPGTTDVRADEFFEPVIRRFLR